MLLTGGAGSKIQGPGSKPIQAQQLPFVAKTQHPVPTPCDSRYVAQDEAQPAAGIVPRFSLIESPEDMHVPTVLVGSPQVKAGGWGGNGSEGGDGGALGGGGKGSTCGRPQLPPKLPPPGLAGFVPPSRQ